VQFSRETPRDPRGERGDKTKSGKAKSKRDIATKNAAVCANNSRSGSRIGAIANEGTSVKMAREASWLSSTLPSRRSTAANLVERRRARAAKTNRSESYLSRSASRAKGRRSLYH